MLKGACAKEIEDGLEFSINRMPQFIKLSDGTEWEFDKRMHRGINNLSDIRWYEYKLTKKGMKEMPYDNIGISFYRITEEIWSDASQRAYEGGVSKEEAIRPHVDFKTGNIHPSKDDVAKAGEGMIRQLVLCKGLGPKLSTTADEESLIYVANGKKSKVHKACYYPMIHDEATIKGDWRHVMLEEFWNRLKEALNK